MFTGQQLLPLPDHYSTVHASKVIYPSPSFFGIVLIKLLHGFILGLYLQYVTVSQISPGHIGLVKNQDSFGTKQRPPYFIYIIYCFVVLCIVKLLFRWRALPNTSISHRTTVTLRFLVMEATVYSQYIIPNL